MMTFRCLNGRGRAQKRGFSAFLPSNSMIRTAVRPVRYPSQRKIPIMLSSLSSIRPVVGALTRQGPRCLHVSIRTRIVHGTRPILRRFPSIAQRGFASSASEASGVTMKKEGAFGKLRSYVKMYGAVFVVTYIGVYICTLCLIYTAIVVGEAPQSTLVSLCRSCLPHPDC